MQNFAKFDQGADENIQQKKFESNSPCYISYENYAKVVKPDPWYSARFQAFSINAITVNLPS